MYLYGQSFQNNVDPWNTYQWASKARGVATPWFEWWYYKITLPEDNKSFFFVYGVVNPWDELNTKVGSRAYVSLGDFENKIQLEAKYNVKEFFAKTDVTYIEVNNNNIATDKHLSGQISDKDNNYSWNINIEKKWSYNAESWIMGKLVTDIEWYPAQADATCSGTIIRNNKKVEFKNASCYQDRNWGTQFPQWWAWIVSNKFENSPDTTLAVGGGKPHIRSMRTPFSAMSIGLKNKENIYKFNPVNLNYINSKISYGTWKINAANFSHAITINAYAPIKSFMDLQFVTPTGEIFHDYETLNGYVDVKLFKKVGLNFYPVLNLHSKYAGIEFGSKNIFNEFQ